MDLNCSRCGRGFDDGEVFADVQLTRLRYENEGDVAFEPFSAPELSGSVCLECLHP